jgi:putative redox protein
MELVLHRATAMTFVARSSSGHWTVMDASPPVGGNGAAMSPFEHLFAALAGCTSVDVLLVMNKKRIVVDDYWVKITAKRREEHPRIATEIHIHYTLVGENIPTAEVAHAIELSETKYCSVSGMLKPAAAITSSFEILTPGQSREIKKQNVCC